MVDRTGIYGPLPSDYRESVQLSNYSFRRYRQRGANANPGDSTTRLAYGAYTLLPVPANNSLRLFDADEWVRGRYVKSPSGGLRIDGPPLPPEAGEPWISLQARYQAVNQFFENRPTFVAQRALGLGGQGMTIHYKYQRPPDGAVEDVVIKVARRSWRDEGLMEEEANTRVSAYARSETGSSKTY
jgi:hypothetical protein